MHFTVTIYYNIISKFQKNRQKLKNSSMVKKKHKPDEWYHTWCLYEISKLSD